jgi:hypothetical protein
MKRLFLAILLALMFPSAALAQTNQPPTVDQIQAVQNQAAAAAGNAASLSGQAASLEAQAASARSNALAQQQQAAQLAAQAQQMRVDATNSAINTANQAKDKADEAAVSFEQANQLTSQAHDLEVKAAQQWKLASTLQSKSVAMAVEHAKSMQDMALTQFSIANQQRGNAAQLTGANIELHNTISILTAQIDNQIEQTNRLLIAVGLLYMALLGAIVLLLVRRNQRMVDRLSKVFSSAMQRPNDSMAMVHDQSIKTYSILDEAAREYSTG